jgi:TolA-binding protein
MIARCLVLPFNYFIKIILTLSVLSLLGCQSTTDSTAKSPRATLADLANTKIAQTSDTGSTNDEQALLLSKQQRAQKLASLYQNILTLEPNEEVRTKIEYRLVQIGTQQYEMRNFEPTDEQAAQQKNMSDQSLANLVKSYQQLLTKFPDRAENEEIQYQLAKALDLQGNLKQSLQQIESLLNKYPNSQYAAELNFRRGDIYYNLQHYTKALASYQAVLSAKNNQPYYINSEYMSAWSLFKMNHLAEADVKFIRLLDYIVALEKVQPNEKEFSFAKLNKRYVSLVNDIQRVLSISFSQQKQSESLVNLVTNETIAPYLSHLYLYRHLLFKNLADFLVKNELKYDAELTYQAFIKLAPNSLWAARYYLNLMDLYKVQGKFNAIRELKISYVQQYGLQSEFWQQGLTATPAQSVNKTVLMDEILPNLLYFSYQQSRYLYAKAQSLAEGDLDSNLNENQVDKHENLIPMAYKNAAKWLKLYLALAKLPEAGELIKQLPESKGLLADEFLFADASFEAKNYNEALQSYEYIAYLSPQTALTHNAQLSELRKDAAFASTITVRALLSQNQHNKAQVESLELKRNQLDKAYIARYPEDKNAVNLAVLQAQYAFANQDHHGLTYYTQFILTYHNALAVNWQKLSKSALKQVQIASQLQANDVYRQAANQPDKTIVSFYAEAEKNYELALRFVANDNVLKSKMRELLAACIYFQGQHLKASQPLLAVQHLLRLAKQVPESTYRINAQFDAANLLLENKQWQQAITELLSFQQAYPEHEFSQSIPAKLAHAYEQLQQWQLAAEQYLVMVNQSAKAKSTANAKDQQALTELMREAQYSAAELYEKAGNINKAITTFRTYAHNYPEPFAIAQEVRFKMSEFYKETHEPNKQYFWYRKLIKFHDLAITQQKSTVRSTYLASIAALGLGEAHQQTFEYTKLTLPLKKSLKRKQNAMKLAISYYQKLLSYQLAEFVPHGTYNLAQMYHQLAADVLASQRPKNLDELALEEYNLLLEEIADPFDEKAIEIHQSNAQRAWQNVYDVWVAKSFASLAQLSPALYNRSWPDQLKWPLNGTETIKGGALNAVRTIH